MGKRTNIGSRLHSVERGNVVAGANEILDDAKGKKQNVINNDVDAELVRLDQSKQDNLTFDNQPTEGSDNPVKSGGVYAADKALSDAIEAILILIPSAATALNQLADKNFVNSSIATDTATFRGTSETGLSEAQFIEWANSLTHDMNDYVFWQTIDEAGNTLFKRYKWNGTQWLYEYTLNNSSFTADQWAAIMSGITSALVEKLNGLPTNAALQQALNSKQDALTFDNVPTENSTNPVKSGGVYSAVKTEEDARLNLAQTVSEIGGDVSQIEDVIPAGATGMNKLVENASMEAYVASIIQNITSSFTLSTADGHINLTLTQTNGQVSTLTLTSSDIASAQDVANLQQLYNNLQQSKPVPVTALPETGQQQGVIYRLAGTTSYSDYMWNGSTWVLMATYNNAIDPRPKKASLNLVTSGGVFDNMGALDVSELNATENPHTLAQYVDLSAALAAITTDYQKGGMSITYVQSSDNKYVQYRLIAQSFSSNTDNWELDVTSKNLIYNPQEYTNTQKETARANIGLSNIIPKAPTGEESLKVTTNENKTVVNIHKTSQARNEIAITDNNDNKLVYIDNNGLHAKEIFYGQNETNLQDKIEYIEAQIGSGGSTRNVVLIMFMGQSNMAGRGVTNAAHPQDAPAVIEGAGYEFRAISDPTKLYPITKTFGNTEDNPQGIDDSGRKTGGPVPSFVNAFYRVAKTTVIGVSASEGGESIVNFQPNTSRYNDAVSRFHAAETYLTNNNYNILARYVVWCQGEKDGDTGMSEADYTSYFNTMASALFAEGIEKMMVIRIGEYNGSEEISYSDIITAQTNLCKSNDNYIMVTTVLASLKAKGLMKDDFHYYQEGYNIEGTLSGLHTANYFLFGKSDVMYDVKTNALYFDSKSY